MPHPVISATGLFTPDQSISNAELVESYNAYVQLHNARHADAIAAGEAATAMPYRPMQATSYCIDVPDSPLYNRIIDTRTEGEAAAKGSTEPMRLDLHNNGDPRYREGLVIGHNPTATPRAGSCIFAHLWRTPGEPTAGCTAMAAETMDGLLAWLRPDARPVFVLLPRAEYERLAHDWRLPERAP